ncbi:hypothetical protein [Aquabacterium sp.]|uniref:hypothetical protein n=1 Tax=Aquabacterium sp. TaxID=1872578 RepID=UPI003D6CF96D
MSKVLKAGLLCLVVGALVWLVTLWRWQTADHDASGAEIVGQLFVLPLVLTAALLVAVWGVARVRADAARPVVAAPLVRPRQAMADVPGAASVDERRFSVAVLQSAVNLSVGDSPAQAWGQLQSATQRPSLDPHLQDVDGAPVFTARLPDLAVGDLRDSLPSDVSDRVVRALALLQSPADDLIAKACELAEDWPAEPGVPLAHEPSPDRPAHLSGMAPPVSEAVRLASRLPRLNIRLAVPSAWSDAEREHASAWLRMRCTLLADECAAFRHSPPTPHVHVLDHADGLWTLLDQEAVQWSREAAPQWSLVLAADSAIDETEVERRQVVGELFTSAHQTGRIPGEAAAGLLLATAQWPGLNGQTPLPARLFRPVRLRRNKSADAAGRVGPAVLHDAMSQALTLCAATPDQLSHVLADGDHRASRTAEVFEALQTLAPALDPMLSVTRVGEACGDLGLAGALVPVALAADLAQQDDEAGVTLALLVQATHERVALALTPWTWTPTPAQATT